MKQMMKGESAKNCVRCGCDISKATYVVMDKQMCYKCATEASSVCNSWDMSLDGTLTPVVTSDHTDAEIERVHKHLSETSIDAVHVSKEEDID